MSNNYPNRRSVRLCGYDYSQSGLYFITICTYGREHLFGRMENGTMALNRCGNIARDCWLETEHLRPNITLGEFVIMPNHFHAVFSIDHPRRGVLHTPGDKMPGDKTPDMILHTPGDNLDIDISDVPTEPMDVSTISMDMPTGVSTGISTGISTGVSMGIPTGVCNTPVRLRHHCHCHYSVVYPVVRIYCGR